MVKRGGCCSKETSRPGSCQVSTSDRSPEQRKARTANESPLDALRLVDFKGTYRYFFTVDVDIRFVGAGTPISRTEYPDADRMRRRSPIGFDTGLVVNNP